MFVLYEHLRPKTMKQSESGTQLMPAPLVQAEHSQGGHGSDNEDNELSGPGAKKEEMSRSKRSLEKYIEDEQLGDMATQAIPLFGNINYPNLRFFIAVSFLY